jgi:Tfp pilus assembly protein PilF
MMGVTTPQPPDSPSLDSLRVIAGNVQDLLRGGQVQRADSLVRQLVTAYPAAPGVWTLDSDVGAALHDIVRILRSARRAIELGDASTHNWLRVAHALRAMRRWDESDTARKAAGAAASSASAHALLAEFCTRSESFTEAAAAYDMALAGDPANAKYRFNRAAVRRFLGQLDAAECDYDQVIQSDPRECEAWLNRADLRTQTPQRNHVRGLMERLQGGFDSWRDEVWIRYALAKELEDLGEYASSWSHLTIGSAMRRRHLQYDVSRDLETVDWIIEAFPEAGTAIMGCPSGAPIFIVGMPRTGTTLLERILAGSTDLFAAGELEHFAHAIVAAARRKAGRRDLSRHELVATSANIDFKALGADYLDRTRPRTDLRARFTDKMPLNYLYCGLIKRALPNAKIVHLSRHPLATCYAVFKVLFNQGYPFSYDLCELADYYIGYRRLMEHWQRILPGQILDVPYERLVTAPESESRRVFEFCGLEWEPRVLDMAQFTHATTTASAAQVRRPIYHSSIDLWKRYAHSLAPLAQRLASSNIPL